MFNELMFVYKRQGNPLPLIFIPLASLPHRLSPIAALLRPIYNGATPTKPVDAQCTYTFSGWDAELSVVTGAQTYIAQYTSTINQYEVTFLNWDGAVLQSTLVNYGVIIY